MKIKLKFVILLMLIFCAQGNAQDIGIIVEEQAESAFMSEFFFFSALISGVLLALAFNLLLTSLATAMGISIAKPEEMIRHGSDSDQKDSSEKSGPSSTIKKINSMFGAWTLVATSICLFLACWLAIEISGVLTILPAIVVALAIWAAFYLAMTALEATVLTTVIGSLYTTATSTLQSASHGLKAVFEKSPESKATDTAAEITESVKDEIFSDMSSSKLKKQIQGYVQQLSPPSAKDIKTELAHLFEQTELDAMIGHAGTPTVDVEHIIAKFEEEHPNKERAKNTASQIRDALKSYKQQRQSGKDTISAGIDSTLQATGKSQQQAQQMREEIETYLRNSNKQELQPEELKHRVETIFKHPKQGLAQLGQSIRSIDHDTAVTLLEQRKDMSHEEAENIANHFEQAMHTIFSIGEKTQDSVSGTKEKIENKLRNYLYAMDEPELDYDAIKDDLILLFHDPKAGYDALISRLHEMDRDTLKSILETRKDIPPERAEKIVSKMEEARDDVIKKANQLKFKVEEKLSQAQESAANAAQQTRENAAIAAWWASGTAIVSGAAAALGGFVAVIT